MSLNYFVLFGLGLGIIAFLLWMLFSLPDKKNTENKEKIRGYCPLCGAGLKKGEQLKSDVLEIGNIEIQTKIKGCPYCLGVYDKRKRVCPVCKKKVPIGEVILAVSDPRVDKKKLSIRGCKNCYSQGFSN